MTDAAPGEVRVAADEFRSVMARFATGVVVVTCAQDAFDHAMTANAFASVSLEPPLVLVCVENDSRFHEAISHAEHWAVNVLEAGQRGRASWFATRGRPLVGQFDSTPTTRSELTGSLLLDGALATLECRTVSVHQAGDHDIVVGEVLGMRTPRPDGDPLVYFRSSYRRLTEGPESRS